MDPEGAGVSARVFDKTKPMPTWVFRRLQMYQAHLEPRTSENVQDPLHQAAHRHGYAFHRATRYHLQLWIAQPTWASRKAIRKLDRRANRYGLTVDHIVPLNHPQVCGLHCADNMQLLTAHQNSQKSNHWWPDMPSERIPLPFEHKPHQMALAV